MNLLSLHRPLFLCFFAATAWLGAFACSGDDTASGGSAAGGASSSGTGGTTSTGGSTSTGGGGTGGSGGSGGGGGSVSYTERCQEAAVIWVAKDGVDGPSCGAVGSDCLTIKHALGLAVAGDAVCVRGGQYDESWVEVPSDVTLISADGDQAAIIYSATESAVRFSGVSGASLKGFEVYGDWDQGSPGDGLIRVVDATNIEIYRVVAHDAPHDQDVVKVSGQVSGLLIDGLVAWNPAHRTNGMYQENVDIFGSGAQGNDPPPVSDVIVRNSWLFHGEHGGDFLIYAKIYVERILYENNVFGPSAGGGWGNVAVGVGTGEVGIPDPSAPVITEAIVRNNVFVGLKGDAALGVFNSEDVWIYNNTFHLNSGPDLRSVIMLRGNSHQVGATYAINNLFLDNQPSLSGGSFYWVRELGLPTFWGHHHNLYQGNIGASDTPYTGETGSLYDVDPGLTAPAIPATDAPTLAQVNEIKAAYGLAASSPAVGAGVDVMTVAGHPNWHPGETDRRWDYQGQTRPNGGAWDIGADQR